MGGIPLPAQGSGGATGFGVSGFGNDPVYPFKNAGIANLPISTVNRSQPFFEFKGDRLVDDDGDGIPGYLDPSGNGTDARYYVYFASYGAPGYDPNDCNFGVAQSPDDGNVGTVFRVGFPVAANSTLHSAQNVTYSQAPNPYTSTVSVPHDDSSPTPPFSATQPTGYQNTTSFQIISAGGDRAYGPGGQYSGGTGTSKLPLVYITGSNPPQIEPLYFPLTPAGMLPGVRDTESDNVTNFTSGRLN